MTRSRPIAGQRARVRSSGPTSTTVLDNPTIEAQPAEPAEPAPPTQPTEPTPLPKPSRQAREPRGRQRWADWSTGARVLLAGLLALALTALAAFGLVGYRVRADQQVETARDQATAAAQGHAVAILSYDYHHLDQDFAAARKTLTGAFARDYAATTRQLVRPGATQYHVVVKAEVAAESVVSATADTVVVLLFVNQTTTSTRLAGPRVDLNRVRLTLVKVNGSWLVNNVDAL